MSSDQARHLARMSHDHEVRSALNRRPDRSIDTFDKQLIGPLNGQWADSAPNDERRDINGGQRLPRKWKVISARPVEDVDPRGLDRVGANPRWPRSEDTDCPAVEVKHCSNGLGVAVFEIGEVGVSHPTKGSIKPKFFRVR